MFDDLFDAMSGYLDLGFRLFIGALVVAGILYAIRPRYTFTILLEGGVARASRGAVPRGFLREVERALTAAGVPRGKVHGIRRGKAVVLSFSAEIPADCRQQLRNLWQIKQISP